MIDEIKEVNKATRHHLAKFLIKLRVAVNAARFDKARTSQQKEDTLEALYEMYELELERFDIWEVVNLNIESQRQDAIEILQDKLSHHIDFNSMGCGEQDHIMVRIDHLRAIKRCLTNYA